MATKKPIQVTLKETNHPTQPWVYIVDYGGNTIPQKGKDRYTKPFSAKRGCARAEGFNDCGMPGHWFQNKGGRQVVFTTKRRK